jgi:1-acyl-sn-glycerol-3-phosphate acyltransferase
MGLTRVVAWIGRNCLGVLGWKVIGGPPVGGRYVLIAAPHTSNWDFPLMLLFGMALGFRPSWVGKDTLFRAPFGALMRALGGIPVDRSSPRNMVEQLAERFRPGANLILAMPPEGTRGYTRYWKSGFYYVALRAGVPIAPSFLDYGRKQGGIGPLFVPSGNLSEDMDTLRAFYAGREGRYPHLQGPVRLQAEDEVAALE